MDAFFVKHARQSFYILFKRLAFLENLHKASLQPIFENKESMNSKLYFYEETGPQRSQKEPKRSQMLKKETFIQTQCLKISQNVSFGFFNWHFPPIFCPLKSDLSGNTV